MNTDQNISSQINLDTNHINIIKSVFDQYKKSIDAIYDKNTFHLQTPDSLRDADISSSIGLANQCVQNDGLAIEFYYGIPIYLWTKYGKIRISKSDQWYSGDGFAKHNSLTSLISDMFECSELIPKTKYFCGEYGPVYQLNKVDGISIPSIKIDQEPYNEESYLSKRNIISQFKQYV